MFIQNRMHGDNMQQIVQAQGVYWEVLVEAICLLSLGEFWGKTKNSFESQFLPCCILSIPCGILPHPSPPHLHTNTNTHPSSISSFISITFYGSLCLIASVTSSDLWQAEQTHCDITSIKLSLTGRATVTGQSGLTVRPIVRGASAEL